MGTVVWHSHLNRSYRVICLVGQILRFLLLLTSRDLEHIQSVNTYFLNTAAMCNHRKIYFKLRVTEAIVLLGCII